MKSVLDDRKRALLVDGIPLPRLISENSYYVNLSVRRAAIVALGHSTDGRRCRPMHRRYRPESTRLPLPARRFFLEPTPDKHVKGEACRSQEALEFVLHP